MKNSVSVSDCKLSFFSLKVNEPVEVLVENVNDNPPNFAQSHYVLEVNEVSGAGVLHKCVCFRFLTRCVD